MMPGTRWPKPFERTFEMKFVSPDKRFVLYLFPLVKLESRLENYYMDSTGSVYSTAKNKFPQCLAGSHDSIYRSPKYTLKGVLYNGADLVRRAKLFKNFKAETSEDAPGTHSFSAKDIDCLKEALLPNRSHASTIDEGLSAKGWLIARVDISSAGEVLMFGSKPAIHLTNDSVKAEMLRLAKLKPGVKFVSFKVDKTCVASEVIWK